MSTIATALRAARERLSASDTASLDAELLLCESLGCERSHLFTWPEQAMTVAEQHHFEQLLQRRIAGEPVAYIIGRRDFWDLSLAVDGSTLIPRPDTETLLEQALDCFPAGASRVLDLGTGTGAIALALAREWPASEVLAVDISAAAVALAKRNCLTNDIHNVQVLESAWFSAVPNQRFDLITSNPPYIDADDPHLQQGDVRFEPHSALVAGEQGMADLNAIIAAAPNFLNDGGYLLLEHGYQQAPEVRAALLQRGFSAAASRQDIAGHERISFACWPG